MSSRPMGRRTMAERIRLSRAAGFRLPPNTINVARPGKLGNPFVVGKWGTRPQCVSALASLSAGFINLGTSQVTIDAQLALWGHIHAVRDRFAGRDVACWCSLDGPCHGDVYLHLWNGGSIADLARFAVEPPRPGLGMMAWDILQAPGVPA